MDALQSPYYNDLNPRSSIEISRQTYDKDDTEILCKVFNNSFSNFFRVPC